MHRGLVDDRLSYHQGMSIGAAEGTSSAATAVYREFLEPFETAIAALEPLGGTPRIEEADPRRWLVLTLHPGRTDEVRRAGNIHLKCQRLGDRRLKVDIHQTLELSSTTVLTASGHLVCRDDPWNSLESWDVRIEQRLTPAAKKIRAESFDRVCRGRVIDGSFEVEGRTGERLQGGPVVSELVALLSPQAMVDAPWVHLVRDFDAVTRQQRFQNLGVARTSRGHLQAVLQTGAASLPTTYWLCTSGLARIVRHGTRLFVAQPPSAQWPGAADE